MAKAKRKTETAAVVEERIRAVADSLNGAAFSTHRGSFWSGNTLYVFGNDGYAGDPRARSECEAAKVWALEKGFSVEGFGTNNTGYSWVLELKYSGPELDEDSQYEVADEAETVLKDAWLEACEKFKGERVASAIFK